MEMKDLANEVRKINHVKLQTSQGTSERFEGIHTGDSLIIPLQPTINK